ncbi:MAG: chemotaxis response regulator protein-glutamate methylesterase [Bacteroidetes bacterium 4572_77]|nr:MAG: chemotaxis response regulator protein-glutamate methylesterase [Bacteroidetes bacterium 4572_77]
MASIIKVLIVEDSRTVSQYLEYILSEDDGIEVIGNVANGKEAIDFVNKTKPDVISMDIDMPIMNGLEATRIIMSTIPVPIIVVTASVNAAKTGLSIEALAAGALTVIPKPVGFGHVDSEIKTKKLLSLVKIYAQVKVVKRKYINIVNNNKPKKGKTSSVVTKLPPLSILQNKKYVAIGISSGGPQVLAEIFSKLSKQFPYPILVVQHITPGFLEGMVAWLGRLSEVPIHIASQKEKILPGHIYFAPDYHEMYMKDDRIHLKKCPKNTNICPSVAYLFKSMAKDYAKYTIALLLTGMGRDGSYELKVLKDAGAVTIAQDKESSLVHGMPGEAIKMNAADYVLSPNEIISMLKSLKK